MKTQTEKIAPLAPISNLLWPKDGVITLTRAGRIFQFVGHVEARQFIDDIQKIIEASSADLPIDCSIVVADADQHALLPNGFRVGDLRVQVFNEFAVGRADLDAIDETCVKHASSKFVSVFVGPLTSLTPTAAVYGQKYCRKVLMRDGGGFRAEKSESDVTKPEGYRYWSPLLRTYLSEFRNSKKQLSILSGVADAKRVETVKANTEELGVRVARAIQYLGGMSAAW